MHSLATLGIQARARDLAIDALRSTIEGTSHSFAPPSGGTEGVAKVRDLTANGNESKAGATSSTDSSSIGILPLSDGRIALGIALPFGSARAETLISLCEAAIKLGATGIRPGPARSLLLMGMAHTASDALRLEAKKLDFVTAATDPRTRIAACPGAPACASGMIAARDVAAEIARTIGPNLDPTLSLHVSGCAKGCAHPGPAALTIVGDEKGAAFVVGGTAKGLPAAYTAGYEAARGVGRLTELLAAERQPHEDATACLARLGAKRLAQTLRQG